MEMFDGHSQNAGMLVHAHAHSLMETRKYGGCEVELVFLSTVGKIKL